jgi:hypothetical protein
MNHIRAVAQFITSEVLLPATIVCLCVLIAAQLLPLVASNLNGEFEKRITHSGIVTSTGLADARTPNREVKP